MHKFVPRIHLVLLSLDQESAKVWEDLYKGNQSYQRVEEAIKKHSIGSKVYQFPETVFTAVTAYQNQLVMAS